MSGMFNSVEIIVDHSVGTRHLFLLSCCFLFFSGFVSIGPVGVPPWWWWSWNTPFVSNGLWHLHKLVIIPSSFGGILVIVDEFFLLISGLGLLAVLGSVTVIAASTVFRCEQEINFYATFFVVYWSYFSSFMICSAEDAPRSRAVLRIFN